jgi:heat shock protein HslJ
MGIKYLFMKQYLLFTLTIFLLSAQLAHAGKKPKKKAPAPTALSGSWTLNFITGPRIAFDGLFPDRKPTLEFDAKEKRVYGQAPCNRYNGPYTHKGDSLRFSQNIALTMMACEEGQGENLYVQTLKKINRWKLNPDGQLELYTGDIMMMRYHRSKK